MNSRQKIKTSLEAIRALEEKSRLLYDIYLGRLKDPAMIAKIKEIRDEEAAHVQLAEELLALFRKHERSNIREPWKWDKLSFFLPYLAGGVLLGLGAPVGSLIFRIASSHPVEFSDWIRREISENSWFYFYMAVGTVTAFVASAVAMALIHRNLRARAQDLGMKARFLERKSSKDALTGLFNFGYVRERLAVEMERAARFQTPLSCLMIDIDNLKVVNDRYGHPAGDELLRTVAHLIQKEIRVIDTATRYGGDEFFVILPVTPEAGSHVVAGRIREKVNRAEFRFNETLIPTTLSVGAATFPSAEIHDMDSLINAADQALYENKRAGAMERSRP